MHQLGTVPGYGGQVGAILLDDIRIDEESPSEAPEPALTLLGSGLMPSA